MLNANKFRSEILKVKDVRSRFAVNENNDILYCRDEHCIECIFDGDCQRKIIDWLLAEC